MKEFNLAWWFIQVKASQGAITDYVWSSLSSLKCSFSSGLIFTATLKDMHTNLVWISWQYSEIELGGNKIPYVYPDPMVYL